MFSDKFLSCQFDAGKTATQISHETGLKVDYVRKRINNYRVEHGLLTIVQTKALETAKTREKIIRLSKAGLNGKQIFRQTGISYETVSNVICMARKDGELPPLKFMKTYIDDEKPAKRKGLIPYAGKSSHSSNHAEW